jgi:sulfate adenylyltransferase subunit 1 (EFTu-like GTPase family)
MNPSPTHSDSLLRFMTCGSVDDGKSTLIGRLLFDTKTILADTLNQIEKTSKKRGMEAVDLSLLTDGLQAERDQGITIDTARSFFKTPKRDYIIIVAPGVLLFLGLIQTGKWDWLGGILLLMVAAILAWLTALSWPALSVGSRAMRALVLAALLGITILKFAGRF